MSIQPSPAPKELTAELEVLRAQVIDLHSTTDLCDDPNCMRPCMRLYDADEADAHIAALTARLAAAERVAATRGYALGVLRNQVCGECAPISVPIIDNAIAARANANEGA